MTTQMIYCSACDREVAVILAPRTDDDGVEDFANLVCTEIGTQCTGTLCPLCARPAVPIESQQRDAK